MYSYGCRLETVKPNPSVLSSEQLPKTWVRAVIDTRYRYIYIYINSSASLSIHLVCTCGCMHSELRTALWVFVRIRRRQYICFASYYTTRYNSTTPSHRSTAEARGADIDHRHTSKQLAHSTGFLLSFWVLRFVTLNKVATPFTFPGTIILMLIMRGIILW